MRFLSPYKENINMLHYQNLCIKCLYGKVVGMEYYIWRVGRAKENGYIEPTGPDPSIEILRFSAFLS